MYPAEAALSILWRCDACGGPAAWCFINGVAHYWCFACSHQLEMFEVDLAGEPSHTCGVDVVVRGDGSDGSGDPFENNQAVSDGLPF